MTLKFRATKVSFDPTKGRRQREPGSATFLSKVKNASVALRGFRINFTDKDHHIKELEIDIDKGQVIGQTVYFNVDFVMRDGTGSTYDDRYNGWVEVLTIADVE